MKHLQKGRKFHRGTGQRTALIKSLAHNLIVKGKIVTTEAKAKEIKTRVEKLVTLGKKQDTASLRLLLSRLPKKSAQVLFYEVAPKYKERKGGYLKVTKSSLPRKRDASKMAMVEFV